jgi:hypothetical protein
MASPTQQNVLDRVRKDFAPSEIAEVIELLSWYGEASHERDPELMRLAILRLVNGDLDKLWHWVDMAKRDWRDVLLAVHQTYGHDWPEGFLVVGEGKSPTR